MRYYLIIPFFLLLIQSCVFEPGEDHFVEVSQDVTPPEIINKTLDFDSDTLFVWRPTRFNFDLESSNQAIVGVYIKYGNIEQKFYSGKGSFEVLPQHLSSTSPIPLEMKVYTKTGTGSLADVLGSEAFEFSNTWVLQKITPTPPKINFHDIQIENGFLTFSWDKVKAPYFSSYQISISNPGINDYYTEIISDKETTSFQDSLFVGGKAYITFAINYEDENGYGANTQKEVEYEYPIVLYFEEDVDSLTISWDNPFRSTKYVALNSGDWQDFGDVKQIKIKAQGIGPLIKYNIGFQPIKDPERYSIKYRTEKFYTLGESLELEYWKIGYNSNNNSYFTKSETNVTRFSAENITSVAEYQHDNNSQGMFSLAFSKNGQYVYTFNNDKIITLNSNTLSVQNSITVNFNEALSFRYWLFENLNDQVFIIANGTKLVLYDVVENKLLDKSPELSEQAAISRQYFSVAPNGKYVSYCDGNGLKIFEIVDNKELILRFENEGVYVGGFFDPINPNILYLNGVESFYVWDCTTMSVKTEISEPYGNPINIDPATGYLLISSNKYNDLNIYDLASSKVILKMNHHDRASKFTLLNNKLFTESGYYYAISKHIN